MLWRGDAAFCAAAVFRSFSSFTLAGMHARRRMNDSAFGRENKIEIGADFKKL